MIEVEDEGALAQHFHPVETAIGVERITRVVRGDGDDAPAALNSLSSVAPRRIGVRTRPLPLSRSCRSMLHIGSDTMAIPASTALSMVVRTVRSSCTVSTQQCPAITLPL